MEFTEFFQTIKAPATILHVISVIFGMGAALMSDILFSFFSKDKKLNKTEIFTLSVLANVVLYSLVIIIVSGVLLFFSDIPRYMSSPKFLAKITILCILIVNGYVLNTYVWPHLLKKGFFVLTKERNLRKLAFVSGAVSVISWIAVCALGVLDSLPMSYLFILSVYCVVIISGSVVALFVERREFN